MYDWSPGESIDWEEPTIDSRVGHRVCGCSALRSPARSLKGDQEDGTDLVALLELLRLVLALALRKEGIAKLSLSDGPRGTRDRERERNED